MKMREFGWTGVVLVTVLNYLIPLMKELQNNGLMSFHHSTQLLITLVLDSFVYMLEYSYTLLNDTLFCLAKKKKKN